MLLRQTVIEGTASTAQMTVAQPWKARRNVGLPKRATNLPTGRAVGGLVGVRVRYDHRDGASGRLVGGDALAPAGRAFEQGTHLS
jgi:hypothetical protein